MAKIKNFFGKLSLAAIAVFSMASGVQAQFSNGGAGLSPEVRSMPIGAGISEFKLNPAGAVSAQSARSLMSSASPRMPLVSKDVMPLTYSGSRPADMVAAVPGSTPSVGSQAFGTTSLGNWPYSHERVGVTGNTGPGRLSFQVPVTSRPYRFSGKLFMQFGSSTFVCSASLIDRGVLVTAAHCVYDYATQTAADSVFWVPAQYNSSGGIWAPYNATDVYIPDPYRNANDTCQNGADGIVCNNDIATVVLESRNGLEPGAALGGWFRYAANGFSYTDSPAFNNFTVASITQLGYPVAFDSGFQMQRVGSMGKYITSSSTTTGNELRNTQLGSSLTGGSSGGPWIVNFGTFAVLTNPTEGSHGQAITRNVIVGTTSWGYTDRNINVQGASWFGQNAEFPLANYGGFGAGNIGALVQATCTANPTKC